MNSAGEMIINPEILSAVIGAVVGAVAASIPAYLLAQKSSREVLKRDRIQRKEQEKAAAFKAFTKILALSNSVLTIEKHIEDMARRPSAPGAPLARRISALAGLSAQEIVFFEADELALFAAAGRVDYVNDLQLLSRQHAAIVQALLTYKERKEIAQQILDEAEFHELETGAARYHLSDDGNRRLAAQERNLEALIIPLRTQIQETARFARTVADKFGPIVHEYFPGEKMPNIVEDERPATVNASASQR